MSIFFASLNVGYKIVDYKGLLFSASVFVFPLLFPLNDVIAEIYDRPIGTLIVFFVIFCEFIYILLTNIAIRLPSPPSWHHQGAYNYILGGNVHIFFADLIALSISSVLNVKLLTRWKIIYRGNYFFLRSFGSTCIGELVFTILTNLIAYHDVISIKNTLNIIISDYFFKLIYSFIICLPTAYMVAKIKNGLGIKNGLKNYNPFVKNNVISLLK